MEQGGWIVTFGDTASICVQSLKAIFFGGNYPADSSQRDAIFVEALEEWAVLRAVGTLSTVRNSVPTARGTAHSSNVTKMLLRWSRAAG